MKMKGEVGENAGEEEIADEPQTTNGTFKISTSGPKILISNVLLNTSLHHSF